MLLFLKRSLFEAKVSMRNVNIFFSQHHLLHIRLTLYFP